MQQMIRERRQSDTEDSSKFELIAFDMDGTLIELNIPFDEIREKLGIKKRFILESIMEETDLERRREMFRILEEYEIKSALDAVPAYYARKLIEGLDSRVIKGIITRNSRRSAEIVAERLGFSFDFIIGREDAHPKPSPAPLRLALDMFDVEPSNALMVGDFLFDLLSGRAAGVRTALIITERNREMVKSFIQYADYVFNSLEELAEFLGVRG
ncbi:HAD family hydrolase [Archaeoglobus neptunius]|uniref:HAD family hydrolase n=1 Tax=Archaeoglobus neptunius TaxID=2798580 RepID=UPI0019266FFF|nr:HAD family hydrolase [Archaeoglobus neptunius]